MKPIQKILANAAIRRFIFGGSMARALLAGKRRRRVRMLRDRGAPIRPFHTPK